MKIKQDTIVKPLPSEELIKKHENFWRLKLPSSFLDFIKLYNGAEVKEATFVCDNRSYTIERFLCMLDDIDNNPKGIYDIDVVLSQIGERLTKNEDLLGAEVLPIASIFAGDFVSWILEKIKRIHRCVYGHTKSQESLNQCFIK